MSSPVSQKNHVPTGPSPTARASLRNVHIFDNQTPPANIGGLRATRGVSNELLYDMVAIIVDDSGSGDGYSWYLRDEKSEKVPRDDDPVRWGNYYIVSDASIITLTNETPLTRTATKLSKTRKRLHDHRRDAFTTAVRHRDRGCVVTELQNDQLYIDAGVWDTFDAAHIFPPAYAGVWKQLGLDRYITVPGPGPGPGQGGGGGGSKIDSVQNGILLRSNIHELFDCYAFSISPKYNYKIISFLPDMDNIAGTHLDNDSSDSFVSNPHRPPDELLDWHFRQAVLTNVKGTGEPCFEHDFPPGSDMLGQIRRGPKAGERMEFELFTRLGCFELI